MNLQDTVIPVTKTMTRKVITGIIAFFLLTGIVSCSSGEAEKTNTNNNQQFSESLAQQRRLQEHQPLRQETEENESKPTVKVPSYKVASTNDNRYDGAKTYLTILDGFKGDYKNAREYAKGVVVDVVKKDDKKVSVLVFANQEAYDTYLRKNDTNNLCIGQCLQDVNKVLETGFIAWYSGFLDTALSEHNLDYFPAAFKDNATVGKYVGSEEFVAENSDPAS